MSASVDNLAFNKKGTKVVITGKPKYYNLLGTTIQWLPSLIYIAIKFDLFTFENQGYAITGWGVIGVALLFLAFRSKIKESLNQYEEQFGATWNRAKSGNIALTIATVLFGVYFIAVSFIIFFIFAGSTYLSLFFYAPYDKLSVKKTEMQKLLDDKNKEADFEKLTQRYNELKEQKTI